MGLSQSLTEVCVFLFAFKKAVSDGPELLSCVLLGLDSSLLLGLVDRAVQVVVHDVEVRLWNEIFHIFLPELNITAKGRFSQTVGEAGDLEGVEDPFTDQVGVLDHLDAGDLSE